MKMQRVVKADAGGAFVTFLRASDRQFRAAVDNWRPIFEEVLFDLSMSPEWTIHAAGSAGLLDRLCILTVESGSGTLLGSSLFIDTVDRMYGIRLRIRELPGNRLVAYHHELLGARPQELLERIVHAGGAACDVICVPAVLRGSPTDQAAIECAARNRWTVLRYPGYRSPYIAIGESWESYLAGKSSNFRQNLKRKRRALESFGRLSERWYTASEDVEPLLDCVCKIESSSWKAKAGMSITGSEQEMAYHRLLLPWLAEKGALSAIVLFVESEPVAYSIGYRWKERVAQIKTSFDERYHTASPGLTVNAIAIRNAFETDAREFDFLGDVMPHKMKWTNDVRVHDNLFLFTRTPKGRLIGAAKSIAHRMRRIDAPTTIGRSGHRLRVATADDEPSERG